MTSNDINNEELTMKFYESILYTFLRLNEIENKNDVKIMLLKSLHPELKDLLWLISTPEERECLSYKDILKILMNHLKLNYDLPDPEDILESSNYNEMTESIKQMNIINKHCIINEQTNIVQNLLQPESTIKNPFPFKLGYKLKSFTGRQDQLTQIRNTLTKSLCKVVVIHGLSGIGKSALVNEYAWLHMQYYNQTIAWFNVRRIELEFLELAGEVNVSTKTKEYNNRPICQVKKDIYTCLQKKDLSLLIFDDALTLEDVEYFLPVDKHIDILITSPQGNWNTVDKIELQPLTLTESETVLKQIVVNKLNKSNPELNEKQQLNLKNQSKEISEIIEIINGIPVAVEICGAYIVQQYHLRGSHVDLLQYIKELKSVQIDYEDQTVANDSYTYEKNVYVSFDVTYKKLCKMKNISLFIEEILNVLNVCAYLNSSGIPVYLIQEISEIKETDTLLTIFRILADFSLINYNYDEVITIHNLIQHAIIFNQKKINEDLKWFKKVLVYLLDNSECEIDQISNVFTYANHHLHFITELFNEYYSKLIKLLILCNNLDIIKYLFDTIDNPKNLVKENNLLHFAACIGKRNIVEYLLYYSDINDLNDYGYNAVQVAIQNGHLEITTLFLDLYPHLTDHNNKNGNTLLHMACQYGYVDICDFFLSKYNFESMQNDYGDYPIHIAIEYNHSDIIELFIYKAYDLLNWTKKNGDNLLHIAVKYGHIETCKILLDAEKYNFESMKNNNNDYPIYTVIEYENLDVMQLFFNKTTNLLKWTKQNDETLIHTATRTGNIRILKFLIKNGNFDVNSASEHGFTPLILAAASGLTEAVSYLLSQGASPELCDKNHWSPLFYATWRGHADVVQLLVTAPRCDVNAQNLIGFTCLHYAFLNGNLSIVEMLCDAGARIDTYNNNNQTPLDLVSLNVQTAVCKFLKKRFPSLHLAFHVKRTTIDYQ